MLRPLTKSWNVALQVVCLGYNKLVDLPVEMCNLNCLEFLEVVKNSIDTMPLYLLRGAESMDFAMMPLVDVERTCTEGACSADALLEEEQELFKQSSQWCVHVCVLVRAWHTDGRNAHVCILKTLEAGRDCGMSGELQN